MGPKAPRPGALHVAKRQPIYFIKEMTSGVLIGSVDEEPDTLPVLVTNVEDSDTTYSIVHVVHPSGWSGWRAWNDTIASAMKIVTG